MLSGVHEKSVGYSNHAMTYDAKVELWEYYILPKENEVKSTPSSIGEGEFSLVFTQMHLTNKS